MKEKICKNCRYFKEYYPGSNTVSFAFARNVCVVKLPTYVKEDHFCGYWEDREEALHNLLPNVIQHQMIVEQIFRKIFHDEETEGNETD